MVGADGEVGRRRPRLDLLVRAIEDWESILSGGMELDGTLLARLEKLPQWISPGFRLLVGRTRWALNI